MMTRREALMLLAAAPIAAADTMRAQARRDRRIISAGLDTFLIEADGTVKGWSLAEPYGWMFGLGHANRVPKYTAFTVPGLRDVVAMGRKRTRGTRCDTACRRGSFGERPRHGALPGASGQYY